MKYINPEIRKIVEDALHKADCYSKFINLLAELNSDWATDTPRNFLLSVGVNASPTLMHSYIKSFLKGTRKGNYIYDYTDNIGLSAHPLTNCELMQFRIRGKDKSRPVAVLYVDMLMGAMPQHDDIVSLDELHKYEVNKDYSIRPSDIVFMKMTLRPTPTIRCVPGQQESGWYICGKEGTSANMIKHVTRFSAMHPEHDFVCGNPEYEIYATSKKSFDKFIQDHPPEYLFVPV